MKKRYDEKTDTACVTHLFFPRLFPFCALSFATFAFLPPFFTGSMTSVGFVFAFLRSCSASVAELARLRVLRGDSLAGGVVLREAAVLERVLRGII
jgi:hypothetical protein